jgi:DNA-binding response OmpR family regulator
VLNPDLKILVIEKDDERYQDETSSWSVKAVSLEYCDSMQEAILRLNSKEKYMGITINSDTTDYMGHLHILRDIAPHIPIIIIASNKSAREFTLAIQNGATNIVYWFEKPVENAEAILAVVSQNKTDEDKRNIIKLMYYGNLLLLPAPYRYAFQSDRRVPLSGKEFDILYFLLENKGKIMTPDEIIRAVWGDEYIGIGELLHQTLYTLKRKLKPDVYIENIRRQGYRFILRTEW